ncbi:MAG: hypothetical protein BZY87_02275 [SAR202 cluster bacterium Io17-Chloro-G6]|nr:MAG: hypothetical protein BZY87_02275 [SAR202 cluster bacterium Io17-Chloro-G6]
MPAATPAPGTVAYSLAERAGAGGAAAAPPFPFSTGGTATVNDDPYDSTFFKNYGVNPFIDTEDDFFSTFAMDVDTAAYTVARRFVSDGYLPDPDSIRVEEFINYFKQDYEPPTEDVFAIHIEGAPSAFGTEKHWLMRVGLQGKMIDSEERDDASLVFVIDVSGSMARENRLGLVKNALGMLVEELRQDDMVGIVIYGSTANVLLEPTAGNNQGAIMEAIGSLEPGGSTNAAHGLRLGYQMADGLTGPGRTTRVVLLSDGVANVGNTGSNSILNDVRRYVDQGIQLSTIGFGMGNYNDILMEQLANDGDGNYAYVDTISQARRVFVENLTGMLQVIAKDAKVQVEFNPGVVSRYRLIGYENRRVADEDFRVDTVDAGEVGAGHAVTALYELKFHEDASGQMAKVFLRYEDPRTGEVTEIEKGFDKSQLMTSVEQASARFQLDAAVAEYAEILRDSYWALDGNLKDVRALTQRVSSMLPNDPDVAEFAMLVTRAMQIEEGDVS